MPACGIRAREQVHSAILHTLGLVADPESVFQAPCGVGELLRFLSDLCAGLGVGWGRQVPAA